MQDFIAVAITLAAAAWLARTLLKRLRAPPCRPPSAGPAGTDGFVSIDDLMTPRRR